MPNRISSGDLSDLDIIDALELLSDGTTTFRTSESIVSTTASTKTIVMTSGALLVHGGYPLEPGDIVVISGNIAAGTYTVATVEDDDTFTVVEDILDATGGSADFMYKSGSINVGVDPTNLVSSAQTNLQSVLEDIDFAVNASVTPNTHEILDTLTHWLAEDYYMTKVESGEKVSRVFYSQKTGTSITVFADAGGGQVTVTSSGHGLVNNSEVVISGTTNYDGDYVVSNVAVNTFEITHSWDGDDATGVWRKKIRATEITRSGGKVSQSDDIQYDADGVEYARFSESMSRVGSSIDTITSTKTGGP